MSNFGLIMNTIQQGQLQADIDICVENLFAEWRRAFMFRVAASTVVHQLVTMMILTPLYGI